MEHGDAEAAFRKARDQYDKAEVWRQQEVRRHREKHAAAVAEAAAAAQRHNDALDDLHRRVSTREKAAVETFLGKVLSGTPRPSIFPDEHQIAFDPQSEQAVVELELPSPACIPSAKQAKYVQTRNEMLETARPLREQQELYRNIVAQVCLLTIRVVLNADPNIDTVSLNGRVRHVNPATGHEERPHVISIVVDRSEFSALILDKVDPSRCLKYLNALISPNPFELDAVKPLVEFERSRLNFVDGLGVVSYLDSRPDLMDMSPTEFEHLIAELFAADPTVDSIESLVTSQSNDGGVDGVIYTKQPLGRSMTVVQVKQYARSRNLGPTHVRELIGSIHEVKASNGLLVTTSDFTAIATRNAREFGRIQLINGNELVYLIRRHLHKEVLIGQRSHSAKPPRRASDAEVGTE